MNSKIEFIRFFSLTNGIAFWKNAEEIVLQQELMSFCFPALIHITVNDIINNFVKKVHKTLTQFEYSIDISEVMPQAL